MSKPWWHSAAGFVVDRRVPISFVVITSIIVRDLIIGYKPRDLRDLHDPYVIIGVTCAMLGLALRSWAAGILRKGKVLATTGPYRLCRHPLYLGSALMVVGFCVLVADPNDVWVLLATLPLIYLLTMQREERQLAKRHGGSWAAYAASVPRLLPRRIGGSLAAAWSLNQWRHNREYQAVLTTLLALAALEVWRLYL